jgi:hypothetical protein
MVKRDPTDENGRYCGKAHYYEAARKPSHKTSPVRSAHA